MTATLTYLVSFERFMRIVAVAATQTTTVFDVDQDTRRAWTGATCSEFVFLYLLPMDVIQTGCP
jgi:hypothetical protein